MSEETSPRIARIASRILKVTENVPLNRILWVTDEDNTVMPVCSCSAIKALAASALTQTPDRPKIKVKR